MSRSQTTAPAPPWVRLQLHSQLHTEKRRDGVGGQSKQVEWIGAKLHQHMLRRKLKGGSWFESLISTPLQRNGPSLGAQFSWHPSGTLILPADINSRPGYDFASRLFLSSHYASTSRSEGENNSYRLLMVSRNILSVRRTFGDEVVDCLHVQRIAKSVRMRSHVLVVMVSLRGHRPR